MKLKRIIPLFVATSILFTSCGKEEEVVVEESYTAVKVTSIEPSTIQKVVTYNGKFEPIEQATVVAKLSGTVLETYKNVGDNVAIGDSLYTVDASDINTAVEQAEAQAKAASLAVESAENAKNNITGAQFNQQLSSMEASIKSLESQLVTAKEGLTISENTYNNTKTLYEAGAVSKSEFDQVEFSYKQAKSNVEAIESQLEQTKNTYESTKNNVVAESQRSADIGIAQAQVSASTADLAVANASKNLKDVTPTSPISGVVSLKNVKNDQMVSTGSVAYQISNIDKVVATINVTENIINLLSNGQEVNVSINSVDKTVKGIITEINPIANQSSTYPVKITIDNSDNLIKPGMFCSVEIVSESSNDTFVLPREAVLRNMDEHYVYVVNDGVSIMKKVEVGIDTGKDIEIISGLQSGDKVITEGQTYVSDNETVNVIN